MVIPLVRSLAPKVLTTLPLSGQFQPSTEEGSGADKGALEAVAEEGLDVLRDSAATLVSDEDVDAVDGVFWRLELALWRLALAC